MKLTKVLSGLFWVQAGVNLIGALGPEISFDALWYHLPIARMIAERGWWGIIPGENLATSGLPRVMDYINAGLLWIGELSGMASPEILPKLLSWLLGLLCARMIYRIARYFGDETVGYGAAVLWYTTLVVGWQSIVVYVDLARTFATLIAIWWLLQERWLFSAIAMGIAYGIKNFAGLDAVFLALGGMWIYKDWRWGVRYLLVVAPFAIFWGLLNVAQGYSFFYPIGAHYSIAEHTRWVWQRYLGPFWELTNPTIRIGPVVLIIIVLFGKEIAKLMSRSRLVIIAGMLLVSWYIAPRSWDGRYFLPTLAILTVITSLLVFQKRGRWKYVLAVGLIILQALVGIGYRIIANSKFVPVLWGYETKDKFLTDHLNFTFADWYDVDGWVEKNLSDQRYLVIGVHNTYYLPGKKWDHESWADPEYCYHTVLVQGERQVASDWELIHKVKKTQTNVYRNHECD